MHRLATPRPLLERKGRRPAEGIKRLRAEIGRQRADDPPAPAVERMVDAVAGLIARGESVPAVAPGHADENDRANVGERAASLVVPEPHRAARDEAGPLDGGEDRR